MATAKPKQDGVLNPVVERANYTRHGGRRTKLYGVWASIKDRCNNTRHKSYVNYGGRGISFCQEWREFASFRDWAISAGYQEGLHIDRINNNGNYSPDNCRFVTRSQNNTNTRKRKHCVSKYRGVAWHTKKGKVWRAKIRANGKEKYLGIYPTALAAALAYDDAACELHGEFATLNFPERKKGGNRG
jgi:hypothetical protein